MGWKDVRVVGWIENLLVGNNSVLLMAYHKPKKG